jgi:hypothetical protein
MLKSFYGGDNMPSTEFKDSFLPESWQMSGQATLYRNVVAPACRLCHLMRGTGAQSDIDFATFEKFKAYADPNRDDRIRAHVIDRGNMPLAKIVFDAFYAAKRDETLATFLESQGFSVRDASGAVLKPGRPVADPGPDRVVRQGATRLSAKGSLFSTAYAWSLVSGPNGATLVDGNTAQPTFNASSDGTYVLSLVTSNGSTQSASQELTTGRRQHLHGRAIRHPFRDIKSACRKGYLHVLPQTGRTTASASVFLERDRDEDNRAAPRRRRLVLRRSSQRINLPTSLPARCCASRRTIITAALSCWDSRRLPRPGTRTTEIRPFPQLDLERRPA